MDKTPLYCDYGGIHKGKSWWLGFEVGLPFVRLDVFQDRLVFTILWFWKTELLKSEIHSIEYRGPRILPRIIRWIKVIHSNPHVSPFLLYHSWKPVALMENLRTLGYPVESSE